MINPALQGAFTQPSDIMEVGRFTYGNPEILAYTSGGNISIGSFCSIAKRVTFVLGGEHHLTADTTYPIGLLFDEDTLPWHENGRGAISIGNDVWIGVGATILSGASIGDGAVVGAGAVIRGVIPPYAIVVGNPAKITGFRKQPKYPNWWEWPLEKIREKAKDLITPYDT